MSRKGPSLDSAEALHDREPDHAVLAKTELLTEAYPGVQGPTTRASASGTPERVTAA